MVDINTRFGVNYSNVVDPQPLTDGTGDSLANDLVLTDEVQVLALSVTLDQYTELLSAAIDGANRHWPEKFISVIYPLIKAAKLTNALCNAIAECIEDDTSGTYTALENWLLDQLQNNSDVTDIINGSGGSQSGAIAQSSEKLGANCDLDDLFGFCKQLVQFMDQVCKDLYEKLEDKSNVLEALPIYTQEVSAIAYFLEYIEFVLNSARDAYLSNYDLAYENEVACDLFCLAREQVDCSLTWEQIADYFAGRIEATSALSTLSDLIVFIVAGSWSGTQFCDVSILIFCEVMRIGASWTGMDLSMLQKIVTSFYNDPDPDWSTLCGCGYIRTYDWTNTDYMGWSPVVGQWATANAYYSTGSPTFQLRVDRTFSGFDGLEKVEAVGTGSIQAGKTCQITVTHSGGQDVINTTTETAGNWFGVTLPSARDGVTYIEYLINTSPGVTVNFDKMRLTGSGDSPPPEP